MNLIEIQYLDNKGNARMVKAFRYRDVFVNQTVEHEGSFTVKPTSFFIEYEGPDGSGYIEKSKILTISKNLDKKEMMK